MSDQSEIEDRIAKRVDKSLAEVRSLMQALHDDLSLLNRELGGIPTVAEHRSRFRTAYVAWAAFFLSGIALVVALDKRGVQQHNEQRVDVLPPDVETVEDKADRFVYELHGVPYPEDQ